MYVQHIGRQLRLIAVSQDSAAGTKVMGNRLSSNWQGVVLIAGASANKIDGNTIAGPRQSGISLEGGNTGNKSHGNSVSCAAGFDCLVVDGPPEVFETNKILGNVEG